MSGRPGPCPNCRLQLVWCHPGNPPQWLERWTCPACSFQLVRCLPILSEVAINVSIGATKCECGSSAVGSSAHAKWCPMKQER